MNNQRGEVVTGVMIAMMAGMMLFGILFVHGGHANHDGSEGEKKHHSDSDHRHAHEIQDSNWEKDSAPLSGDGGQR